MAKINCIPSDPNSGEEYDIKKDIQRLVNASVREGRSSFSQILDDLYRSETVVSMIEDGSLTNSAIFSMVAKAKKKNVEEFSPSVRKLIDLHSEFIMMEAEVNDDGSVNDYDLMRKVIRRMISTGRLFTSQYNAQEIDQIVNTVQGMVSSRFEDFTENTFEDTLQQKREKTKSLAEIFNVNEEELNDAMEESVAQAFDDKKFDGDTRQMHKLWSGVAKKMQVTPDYLLRMITEYAKTQSPVPYARIKDFYLDAATVNPKLGPWVEEVKNASNALFVSLNRYIRSTVMLPAVRIIETFSGNYQMVLSNSETNKFQAVTELNRAIQASMLSTVADRGENFEEAKAKMVAGVSRIDSLRTEFVGMVNKSAGFKAFATQFSNRTVNIPSASGEGTQITYRQFFNNPGYVAANPKTANAISTEFIESVKTDPRTKNIYETGLRLQNMESAFVSSLTGIPENMLAAYDVADTKMKNASSQATFKGFSDVTHYHMMQQALSPTYKKIAGNMYWNILSRIEPANPVKSANAVRDALTKNVERVTDRGKSTLSPQVDTIARVNLKPSPDKLASSYQDVGKDLKTTGEYNSPVSKMTTDIATEQTRLNGRFDYPVGDTVLRNGYLAEGNAEGTLILLDGALMQEGPIKADQYNGEDIIINHLVMYFTTDFSKMFGENRTGQMIEVMSDKGKQLYVPVRKYGISESKKILEQLRTTDNPEMRSIVSTIDEAHIERDIDRYDYLLKRIYKKIRLEQRVAQSSFRELATEFAYSYTVNKAFTDHYYYGNPKNYEKAKGIDYVDKVKREMRASGINPDTDIEGGMGKRQKALILPDFSIDFDLYRPFFESVGLSAEEAELNDGITIIDLDQNARINKSYGSMFNFSGSVKAIYNHMDQETGEHTYIKTNTIVFDDAYAEFVSSFNAERGTPDHSISNLLQLMRETGIQSVSFTSGAKRSKTGKANKKAIEENGEFLAALKQREGWRKLVPMVSGEGYLATEELYNDSYYVQQDQRQPTSETEGKMPTQGLAYFLPLDSGPSIVSALNDIATIEIDRMREELSKEGSSVSERVLKRQKEGEYNPVLEKFKIPGYAWWNDADCLKLVYTSIGSDIKKKAIDTKVNKNILTEIPAFGVALRTYGGNTQKALVDVTGMQHWQFPEVLVPAEFSNRYIAAKYFGSLAEAETYRGEGRDNPIFFEDGRYRVQGDKVFIERIPTSALHSLSLVEIAGFVSPVMENMVAVDPGTQKMSGSDNDGDQRHTMGEFRVKGKLVEFTEKNQMELDQVNGFIADGKEKSEEDVKMLEKRKRFLQDKKKKSLSNDIIALMKKEYETLENGKPKNHRYITTPIDTQKDRKIALDTSKKLTVEKPGINKVFADYPELNKIGSEIEYSSYLDTIYPNSKVKAIVYHGTKRKDSIIDNGFQHGHTWKPDNERNGFWFFSQMIHAQMYQMTEYGEVNEGSGVIYAMVNSEKPFEKDYSHTSNFFEITNDAYKIDESKFDSIIGYNVEEDVGNDTEYIIFEKERIHILGSKKDIEGFKEFVKNKIDKKSSPLSLLDGAAQFDANRNGKIGISIQANDNAAFTYILSQGIQYKRGIPTMSYRNGKVSVKKGNFMALDKKNGIISEKVNTVIFDLANKLNHATDNAKEQSMDLLGMMGDTITFGSILRMSGSTNEEVIRYMQSDFFQHMLSRLNGRQSMLRNEEWRDIINDELHAERLIVPEEKSIYSMQISDYGVDGKGNDRLMALAHFAQIMNVANDIQFTLNPIIRMTKDFGFRPWDLVRISHLKKKLQTRFEWPGFSDSPVLYRNERGYQLMKANSLSIDPFFTVADWEKLPTFSPKIVEAVYNTAYEVLSQSAFSDFDKESVLTQAKEIYRKQSGVLKNALAVDLGATTDTLTLSPEYKRQLGNIEYEESVRAAFAALPKTERMTLLANQVLNNGTAASVQAKGYFSIVDNDTLLEYGRRKDIVISWYRENSRNLSPYGSEVFWIGNLIRHNPRIVENVPEIKDDVNLANFAYSNGDDAMRIVKGIKSDTEGYVPFIVVGKKALAVTGAPRFDFKFNFDAVPDMEEFYSSSMDENIARAVEKELEKTYEKGLVALTAAKIKNSGVTFDNAGQYAGALKKEMDC